ncbi:MAG: hypothetical protein MZW92_15270 [Comamonadaceae bacterium]|nr:hypothetical protein [Comamonadaceae bacterium]
MITISGGHVLEPFEFLLDATKNHKRLSRKSLAAFGDNLRQTLGEPALPETCLSKTLPWFPLSMKMLAVGVKNE